MKNNSCSIEERSKEFKLSKNVYKIIVTSVPTKPGCWNYSLVKIFCNDKYIGEYTRTYEAYSTDTFYPFEQNGKEYALYSKDYTATRVMELPSCKDLCGEENDVNGFCPVEYFVPTHIHNDSSWEEDYDEESLTDDSENGKREFKEYWLKERKLHRLNGQIGFIAGCVWGDDTSWKIQILDLSQISKGILSNTSYGKYLEMDSGLDLSKSCNVGFNNGIYITHTDYFELSELKKEYKKD